METKTWMIGIAKQMALDYAKRDKKNAGSWELFINACMAQNIFRMGWIAGTIGTDDARKIYMFIIDNYDAI
jgi:hypothetical protein